ncbi:MAG TPA: hypothetical protein VMT61_09080 [Candidatus Binataceae bacterium]|nr:hypothetical protein [Candidatus Binataceae bacterium]
MRLVYHREKQSPRPSTTLGWLSGLVLAALPLVAMGEDTDLGVSETSSVADSVSAPTAPDWEQISNISEIAGSDGPVLELPAVATPADTAATAANTNTSQPSDETASADDTEVDPSNNRVGDLSDYEERETVPSALPLWPPPVTVVSMPRTYAGVTYYTPPSIIVVRPTAISPIPPTSPMLPPTGPAHFAGGWWNRVR